MKLVLDSLDGGAERRDFDGTLVRFGRDEANDVVLDGAGDVGSRRHAEARFEGGVWHLRDLDSTNGTYVNGRRITDAILNEGDEIGVGKRGPRWRVPFPEAPTAPAPVYTAGSPAETRAEASAVHDHGATRR